eukprot:364836-Chlamydomonas_euryale.AAC.9
MHSSPCKRIKHAYVRRMTPSGVLSLDAALGGGYPVGRIVEVCVRNQAGCARQRQRRQVLAVAVLAAAARARCQASPPAWPCDNANPTLPTAHPRRLRSTRPASRPSPHAHSAAHSMVDQELL